MSLFLVSFEVSMVVDAPSQRAAERLVTSGSLDWTEEIPNGIATAYPIESLADVDKMYHDSIPWGGDGSRTVREIIT